MSGIVHVRPGPVRFHTDCKLFDPDFSRCTRRQCLVQGHELACDEINLRFTDNHERFKCAHCNLSGSSLFTDWIRTEFMADGTPVDIYKCQTCGQLTGLYQTDKAQRCRKVSDICFSEAR